MSCIPALDYGTVGASMGSPTKADGSFGRVHLEDSQSVKPTQPSGQESVEVQRAELQAPPARKPRRLPTSQVKDAFQQQGDYFPICVGPPSSFNVGPARSATPPVNTAAPLEGMDSVSPPSDTDVYWLSSGASVGSVSTAPARRGVHSDRRAPRSAASRGTNGHHYHPPPTAAARATASPHVQGVQAAVLPGLFILSASAHASSAIPLARMTYLEPPVLPVPGAPAVDGLPARGHARKHSRGSGSVSLSLESEDSDCDVHTPPRTPVRRGGPIAPAATSRPHTPGTPNPTPLQATPDRPSPLVAALARMETAVSMVGLGMSLSPLCSPASPGGAGEAGCHALQPGVTVADEEASAVHASALWLEHRVHRLEGTVRRRDEEIAALQAQVRACESAQSAAQAEARHAAQGMAEHDRQVAALQAQVCSLQTRLADSRSKLQTRESEQAHLRSSCSEAQGRAGVLDARASTAEASLARAEGSLSAVQRELKAQGEGSLELVRKHSEALAKLGAAEVRVTALEQQREGVSVCLAQEKERTAALEAQVAGKAQELVEKEQALEHARGEIGSLRAACEEGASYKERCAVLEVQCSTLQALVLSLREACAHAQSVVHAKDAALQEHTAAAASLQEELGLLSTANRECEAALAESTGRVRLAAQTVQGRLEDAVLSNLHLQRAALVLQAMVGQGSKLASMWATVLDAQLRGESAQRLYPHSAGNRVQTLTLTLPTPLCLVPGQSTLLSLAKPLGVDADYVRGSWPAPSTPASRLSAYEQTPLSLMEGGSRGSKAGTPLTSYLALVHGVAPSSVCAQLGIQPGDLLLSPTVAFRGKYQDPACIRSPSLLPLLEGAQHGEGERVAYLWRPDVQSNALGLPLHLPSSHPDSVILTHVHVSFTVCPYGGKLLQQSLQQGGSTGPGMGRMQMLAVAGPELQLAPRWTHGPVPERPLG